MSAVPTAFGKYFLTEKIATGGMAEIYLAKLLGPGGFEKFLIIKKIHPELSGQRQFVELFVAEAKTLVGLSHGNIVPIYELGMVDSTYFIAMEYIDGPTLEQLSAALATREAAFSPAMTAYVCAELLKGLDYAHRKGEGVIHRDLSPRNVMVSREGEVKLVDFGIAVARAAEADEGKPTGSYPHMSPEQARGQALDPRSDLFAVGILLWEMLAGRSLFARKTDADTLEAVATLVVPPPSDHCPNAAGVLDVICAKALERDLDKRYKTAGEFLIAINRYLYSQAETVTAEDISRFVARHCPPTTAEARRPKTIGSGDPLANTAPKRSGTVPIQRSGTTPFERGDTLPPARARGKERAETVRTFATNVNFKDVLANATPIHGVPIIAAEDEGGGPQEPSGADSRAPLDSTQEIPRQASFIGDAPRSRLPALLVAILLIGAGAVAAIALSASNEARRPGLSKGASDAAPSQRSAPDAASVLSGSADAGFADASTPSRIVLDAAPTLRRRRADAREKRAAGTVRVGANPWADVFLDGKKIGRAPGSFEVSAGTHKLELRYRDQKKNIPIQIKPGEITSLGVVDFLDD